jgi:hypothetical protein
MLLWSLRTQAPRSVLTLVFTAILVTMALAACARTWRRFFLLTFPLWVLATAYSTCAIVSDKIPERTVALLLSSTSWEEISGLFGVWQQKWMTVPIAGVLALYLVLASRLPVWPVFSRASMTVTRVFLVLTVSMAAYAAQNFAELTAGVALNPVIGSLMFFGVQMPMSCRGRWLSKRHSTPNVPGLTKKFMYSSSVSPRAALPGRPTGMPAPQRPTWTGSSWITKPSFCATR